MKTLIEKLEIFEYYNRKFHDPSLGGYLIRVKENQSFSYYYDILEQHFGEKYPDHEIGVAAEILQDFGRNDISTDDYFISCDD